MTLARMGYAKALCALAILVLVNVFPTKWGEASPAEITLELHPQSPYNAFYIGSDLTVTICMYNSGEMGGTVELHLTDSPPGTLAVGRDGNPLPFPFDIPGKEENENACVSHSIALIASDNAENGDVEFIIVDLEDNEVVDNQKLRLNKIVPGLENEQLASKAVEYGLPENALTLCIPKYRRYWHPELDEIDNAELGYVWLLVGEGSNVLIEDNTGEVLVENLSLPWEIEAISYGEARLWCGDGFENVRVPAIVITGDNSFDFQRFELYYASWLGNPSWITRQSFYWIQGEGISEIPDTERVELWISAENGEGLLTISDYHFCAFRYNPVDSYTIVTPWHCPLPSDVDVQMWFDFVVAEYENVYPMSDIRYDHIGFSTEVHPGSEALRQYMPLIKRNLLGFGLVGILYLAPEIHRHRKRKMARSKVRKRAKL
jgi:hypothetical protein